MTASQAMRYERRRQEAERIERARQAMKQTIIGILVMLALCILMGIAEGGVSDADLEAQEIAHWEAQGIHIVRDW